MRALMTSPGTVDASRQTRGGALQFAFSLLAQVSVTASRPKFLSLTLLTQEGAILLGAASLSTGQWRADDAAYFADAAARLLKIFQDICRHTRR